VSAQPLYKQWTVQNTATKLSTILGTTQTFCGTLTIRNDSGSAGNIFWGASNVTNAPANAGGKIRPGESVTFELTQKFLSSEFIYFVGTAADVAYVTVLQ
jgi:hypothetical protein